MVRFFLAFLILTAFFTAATGREQVEPAFDRDGLIRLHVLANSDTQEDQDLKRLVRDELVAYLQPLLATSGSLTQSQALIQQHLAQLEETARQALLAAGSVDPVRAELGYFQFPTRAYGDTVLPAGRYQALRIVIGKGEGENWWCVLFPPLCFVDVSTRTGSLVPLERKSVTVMIPEVTTKPDRPHLKLKVWEVWLRSRGSIVQYR